jgi:hypothetical protein
MSMFPNLSASSNATGGTAGNHSTNFVGVNGSLADLAQLAGIARGLPMGYGQYGGTDNTDEILGLGSTGGGLKSILPWVIVGGLALVIWKLHK